MEMEILHPVNWTVRAFLDPPDLRALIKKIIKNPELMMTGLKFLFMKGPKYGVPTAHGATPQATGQAPVAPPKTPTPGVGIPRKGPPPIPSNVTT
jgi:hypothetical protein